MKRSSSTRLTRAPSPPTDCSSTAISSSSGADSGFGGRHLPGRPLHGVDDVLVAGAAAEVSRDRPADVQLAGVRVLLEQGCSRQHHARRAEAALQTVLLLEPLLDGVQLARPAEPLDGGDLVPAGLDAEERARLPRDAVEQHGASAAARRATAAVRAGK